jgi:glycosyltransferase involved in cell wall biosynthesis
MPQVAELVKVLTVVGAYLPGFRGGGPTRSLSNLVAHTTPVLAFDIITLNKDHGATTAYPDIPCNAWQHVGSARVLYVEGRQNLLIWAIRLIRSGSYNVLYLNSLFSPFTWQILLFRRFGVLGPIPVVLAPRGELDPAALQKKRGKKRAFLRVARCLRLYHHILWHACSPHEKEDIARGLTMVGAANARVEMIPNLGPSKSFTKDGRSKALPKRQGNVRVVFLSRIVSNKNLLFALSTLEHCAQDVQFDIYGPIEDQTYWTACQNVMERLPANVQVAYKGTVRPDLVQDTMSAYHLLFLPTQFENFGHVILEACLAGCMVLSRSV